MGGHPQQVCSRVGGRGRHRALRCHDVAVRARRRVRAVPDLRQRTLALRTAPRSQRSRLPSQVRRPYAGSKDAAATMSRKLRPLAALATNTEARKELAASRARIVAATDEERRRVVRDLHDGAQQRLVHNGILPSVLTRGGLHAGVDALDSRMPLPVLTDVEVERLTARVEATAYSVVAESLTNVAKHADATAAAVWARVEDGTRRVREPARTRRTTRRRQRPHLLFMPARRRGARSVTGSRACGHARRLPRHRFRPDGADGPPPARDRSRACPGMLVACPGYPSCSPNPPYNAYLTSADTSA
jgi:hypothetical protein